ERRPPSARAQAPEPAPEVVRARLGPEGGSLAVRNVRLIVPAGAFRDHQFVALGVGGVPSPRASAPPTGDTGVLVSGSELPLSQLILLIAPSAADLRAASGDPARFAMVNTATLTVSGCRAQ